MKGKSGNKKNTDKEMKLGEVKELPTATGHTGFLNPGNLAP